MPKKSSPALQKPRPSIWNWRVLVAAVLLPVVGFAAWRGGVMVYGEVQIWRSNRLAAEALDLFVRGDKAASRLAAESSLSCNPRNIEALRLLAGFQLDAGEDSAAMETFQKLSAAGGLSENDARAYARLAGRLAQWEIADGLVAALRAGPASMETSWLEAELALMRKDVPGAEKNLREAIPLDSSNRSREKLVGFLLENRFDRQSAPEVRELLLQTNRLGEEIGLRTLAIGLDKNLAPPQDIPAWLAEVRSHRLSTPQTLLIADRAEVRLDPAAKSRVAENLSQRVRGAPFQERKAAVFWFAKNGEPIRAAELLEVAEAVREPALFEAWLDSLAAANRASEVVQALGTPANPLEDWRKALQRGRASRLLGRTAEADAAYRQALDLTSKNSAHTLLVVEFLGRAGESSLFEDGVTRLLADPRQAPSTLQSLLPVVRGWRDTQGLREFCVAMETSPGLSASDRLRLRNEIAYSDLVLGKKTDPASLAEMSSELPGDLQFQTTQALALLRAGKSEAAVEALVITQAPPDDPFLLARHKALQAMALASYGDSAQATLHYRGLAKEFLSTQEAALVEQSLKKSGRKPR